MGKIIRLLSTICVALFVILNLNGCDKNMLVVIESPTSMYEDYPKSGPPTAKVITVLNEGEIGELIYTRYAKDCEYLKIRLEDGRKGYIGWDGKFRVVPKTKDDL